MGDAAEFDAKAEGATCRRKVVERLNHMAGLRDHERLKLEPILGIVRCMHRISYAPIAFSHRAIPCQTHMWRVYSSRRTILSDPFGVLHDAHRLALASRLYDATVFCTRNGTVPFFAGSIPV